MTTQPILTPLNMDNFDESYWDTNMFLPTEELESFFDEPIHTNSDSSSPDGKQLASKNIVSERNRRKKLNDRLYALRSVVPNITKMDKASIIKDAIEYIQSLNDEEKKIEAEICELESGRSLHFVDFDQEIATFCPNPKRPRMDNYCFGSTSPIELLELKISNVGEKTIVVSLACKRRTDTMVKLCQVFESLKLKIITANMTMLSGRLLKTVFLEADEKNEKDLLKLEIEAAIAALNDPDGQNPPIF